MRMKVERYDYAAQFGPAIDSLMHDIRKTILDGEYILGKPVSDFETAFSKFTESRHTVGLNSGTDALILALQALGIGPGDEVITHANTFYATVAAICHVGAKPVLVDADEATFLMNLSQIESAITSKTKAIVPVHLYGKPTDMRTVLEIARKYKLFVVEDAAQSHGAKWQNKQAGTFGDIGCFSFHPSKNLAAAGDAGAAVTDSAEHAEQLRIRRALGQRSQNHHDLLGFNSKLDNIQALVLSAKLGQLTAWNSSRRKVAATYRELLSREPVAFQCASPEEEHVYHLLQIRTQCRDELLAHLRSDGVDAVVRYPTPIHLQKPFREYGWRQGQFPVAEKLTSELLCLPIRPYQPIAEVEYVCSSIERFFG